MNARLLQGRLPILAVLAIFLLIGLWILPSYSASWDEPSLRLYGEAALKAYRLDPNLPIEETYGPTNHRYYGPAYVMAASLLVNALRANPFGWNADHLWHLASFLTFLASGYALWSICRRVAGQGASLAAVTLFLTQPLLWGHAFINPKDIPFMAFFLIAVSSGLTMVDQAARDVAQSSKENTAPGINQAANRALVFASALFLFLFIAFWIAAPLASHMVRVGVASAYSNPDSLVGQVFHRLASNAGTIPAEAYTGKVMRWYSRLEWALAALGALGACIAVGIQFQARVRWRIGSRRVLLLVFLAALFLGIATSIRLLGPLAGMLVSIYALVKMRARAVPVLAVYALTAIAIAFVTWPFLWKDPIHHFAEALAVMANFPDPFQVRFNGRFFVSQNLPVSFILVMMGITLTEAAVLLILAGLVCAMIDLFRRDKNRTLITLLLAWFLLPLIGWMIWRPAIYDNARQYYFIYPAGFALVSLVFDEIFNALGKAGRRWNWPVSRQNHFVMVGCLVLVALAVLPGLLTGVKIHPYQYAYYNEFVGGQSGAYRRFEVDYWLTSYKEAARYLNTNVPKGSSIVIFGSIAQLKLYADPTFSIQKHKTGATEDADYAILSTRSDMDLSEFPGGKVIYTVGRDGAVYAVIKKLK